MADTKVENETNELRFLNGDEYLYIVDDPTGTPTPSKVAAREFMGTPSLFRNRDWGLVYAAGHAGIVVASIGNPPATTGSADTASGYLTTNEKTRRKRVGRTTGASAGSSAGFRCQDSHAMRGDAAGRGGFRILIRFSMRTLSPTWRAFFGLSATTGAFSNADPSSVVNMIGLGKDSADTAWQIMTNDGTGTATKIAVNSTNFPLDTTSVFEIELYCPPGNGPNVTYWLRNINGVDANGIDTYSSVLTGTITTDLPAAGTLLVWQVWINNDVNAAAASVDFMRCYFENFGA